MAQSQLVDTRFVWYVDRDCLLALAGWVSTVEYMTSYDMICFFEKPYKYTDEWCKYLDIHRTTSKWLQSVSIKCPEYARWARSDECVEWRKSEERKEWIQEYMDC